MIKIQRIPAPKELTQEVVAEKTASYKSDHNKRVWDEPYIKDQLFRMSSGECCYCECKLGEESKYMEVEHFHDKSKYLDEVVSWPNLLPSCKSCNVHKGTHDTVAEPIINPSADNPKDHLEFWNYRYIGKDSIGRETISTLNLNDLEHKCCPRFKVCNALVEKLEECIEAIQFITSSTRTRQKYNFRNKVVEILEACQNDQEYTAVKSTYIANAPGYDALVNNMKQLGLWNAEMTRLEEKIQQYKLDIRV